MKGTLRLISGLLLTAGAAGGFDNATDNQLFPLAIFAVLGLALMASGVSAATSK